MEYPLDFNGEEKSFRLSSRDFSIIKSRSFKERLNQAFESLKNKYVPFAARRILVEVINIILNSHVNGTEKLQQLRSKLLTTKFYIAKDERIILMNELEQYIKIFLSINETNTGNETIKEFADKFRNIEISSPSIIDCFYALTYGGIRNDFKGTLHKAGAHTWIIKESLQKIDIEGSKDEAEFKSLFCTTWDQTKNEFPATTVLKIINYSKTEVPKIEED